MYTSRSYERLRVYPDRDLYLAQVPSTCMYIYILFQIRNVSSRGCIDKDAIRAERLSTQLGEDVCFNHVLGAAHDSMSGGGRSLVA